MLQNLVGGFELLFRGGFMMIPLLISALVALTVTIERLIVLRTRLSTPNHFARDVLSEARKNGFASALALAQKTQSPVAAVLSAGLRDAAAPLVEVELSMQNQAEAWVPQLEKRLEILDTVITAAPLMGLLGTITGMMASFQVLSQSGVSEPHAITGGVAEALIATATGLVIALLCLFAYNYFNAKVKSLIFEMENAASQLVEVHHQRQRLSARTPTVPAL